MPPVLKERDSPMLRHKTAPPRGMLKTSTADPERFEHARYHPSPDLEPYVEHFWVVGWDLRGQPSYRAETLPHPSVHLVFDARTGCRIAGATRGKFSTILEGEGGVFAAKFRPGGFYPFVRKPVSAFTDSTFTLKSVWGTEGETLEQAVLAEPDRDRKMEIVETFLRSLRPEPDENITLATTIADAIAADREILKVEDVARRFELSLRTLQRLFGRYVGVSPKWVIQRYRLHEAAEQLAGSPVSQSELAFRLGYADQAHFVKDFKAIVGTSPAVYAKRARGNR
jgi:AraC-like DNA-binding protein